jgi:hypothetical protein
VSRRQSNNCPACRVEIIVTQQIHPVMQVP